MRSGAEPKENDAERIENDVIRNERDVGRMESDVSRNAGVTSDVVHSIFQIATLAWKNFAQFFQLGRKLDFTHATHLEKLEGDNAGEKGNESEIADEEKNQLTRLN